MEKDDLCAPVLFRNYRCSKGHHAVPWQSRLKRRTLVTVWGFIADTLLHAFHIFHVHGLFVGISCSLMSGSSMYWLEGYSVDSVLQALPECSVMMGVPTYYTRLLANDEFDRSHAKSVRLFISGSAPFCPKHSARSKRTGHRILERYGMTETGMNSSNPLDGDRLAGTVGPALRGKHQDI